MLTKFICRFFYCWYTMFLLLFFCLFFCPLCSVCAPFFIAAHLAVWLFCMKLYMPNANNVHTHTHTHMSLHPQRWRILFHHSFAISCAPAAAAYGHRHIRALLSAPLRLLADAHSAIFGQCDSSMSKLGNCAGCLCKLQ